VQFSFGTRDLLNPAEQPDMCPTDIRNQTVRWVGDAAKHGDLAHVVGSHFHDGNFVVRFNAEHGERHADMVVKVAARGMNLETPGKYRMVQFLGCRLTIATR